MSRQSKRLDLDEPNTAEGSSGIGHIVGMEGFEIDREVTTKTVFWNHHIGVPGSLLGTSRQRGNH